MRNRPVCSLSHTCSCHMFQSHLLRLCSLLLPVLFWQRSVSCFLILFLSFLGSHGQFICLFSCLYHAVLVPAGQCWVSCLLPYCGGYAKSYLSTSTSELSFEPLFFFLPETRTRNYEMFLQDFMPLSKGNHHSVFTSKDKWSCPGRPRLVCHWGWEPHHTFSILEALVHCIVSSRNNSWRVEHFLCSTQLTWHLGLTDWSSNPSWLWNSCSCFCLTRACFSSKPEK